MPTRRSRAVWARKSSSSKRTVPASGFSSPARIRSSVVLPEPDGPSRARNSPSATSSETPLSAGKRPKALATLSIFRDILVLPGRRQLAGEGELQCGLENEGDKAEARQEAGRRERADEVVL